MQLKEKRGRRGQIEIGFGMIFSIIIIIAIVAAAFYAIRYFMSIQECSELGLFYDDFQRELNKAWAASGTTQKVFEGSLPRGVEYVCIGNVERARNSDDADKLDELGAEDLFPVRNLFVYPRSPRCSSLGYYTLDHLNIEGEDGRFKCSEVSQAGKIRFLIKKESTDAFVTVAEP